MKKDDLNALEIAAALGDAQSQYELGVHFMQGENGASPDFKKAAELYDAAAKQNHAEAQYRLAVLYEHARGVEKNFKKAFQLYQAATEHKRLDAQCGLAHCYQNGKGVKKNIKHAIELYEQAAQKNFAQAQVLLASLYYNGGEVERDLKKAMDLYHRAADQGIATAQYMLGILYEGKPEDKGESDGWVQDKALAVHWHYAAAAQGNASSLKTLSRYYEQGFEVGIDNKKSKDLAALAKEAAQLEQLQFHHERFESAFSNYRLGCFYKKGECVFQDYKKAVKHFETAVRLGHSGAQYQLGLCYKEGHGVAQDPGKAQELIAAAEQSYSASLSKLSSESAFFSQSSEQEDSQGVPPGSSKKRKRSSSEDGSSVHLTFEG